ncbi:hypothetical protein K8I61_08095 [bacterium]|nr:hypothetical protein [bacterium]
MISQIGDKGSDARKDADDLFDLIVEPSLEKFEFEIIRADKISTVTSITSEIIELVQNADLCIIDITGHNANVMYECGRRHETGKPYIMLARDGENLPFDITTIRTIFYNIDSGREIRGTVKSIQTVVEKMISEGFREKSSGESLATLADAIKRIERKINEITVPTQRRETRNSSPHIMEVIRNLGLDGAFKYARSQSDVALAEEILPRIESITPRNTFIRNVLAITAAMGSTVAAQRLEQEVIPILSELDVDTQKVVIGGYVQALGRFDQESRGLESLHNFIELLKSDAGDGDSISANDRAFLLNQYQRLLHGAGKHEDARAIGNIVLTLSQDPSYYYNQSINEEECGNFDAAVINIEKLMNMVENDGGVADDDHLARAIDIYCRANKAQKARKAFELLEKVNPLKATLVLDDENISRIIQDAGN